jgi:hypothetical protein
MGVQCHIRELIQRSIAMWPDEDIRENNKGELVSGHCEEIAFIVDAHVGVEILERIIDKKSISCVMKKLQPWLQNI